MSTRTSLATIIRTFACGLSTVMLLSCSAAVAEDVLQIEEHWELTVGGADATRSAPQVSMLMSPTNDVDHDFFIVTLNHWSYPDFAAGGLQIQRWNGENCLGVTNSNIAVPMHHDSE